jgi:hypothetical protein
MKPAHEVGHAGQNRQTSAPPVASVAHAELKPDPHYLVKIAGSVKQGDHRLRDNEPEVALEPIAEATQETVPRIALIGDVDQHGAIFNSHRECTRIVGPLIESPARFEIETRMMPVAGEYAVLDRCAVEREAHVRTPVVEREEPAAGVEQDHLVTAGDNGMTSAIGQFAG